MTGLQDDKTYDKKLTNDDMSSYFNTVNETRTGKQTDRLTDRHTDWIMVAKSHTKLTCNAMWQVRTVMVATDRIAAATQIKPSYAPGGANVHTHLLYGSLGARKSLPKRHLDRFIRFCRAHGQTDQWTDRHTETNHTTPSLPRDHIYAMPAMRPNNYAQMLTPETYR